MPDDSAAPAAAHRKPGWRSAVGRLGNATTRARDARCCISTASTARSDLLLDLAERQRIDLGRISILALVEQFVAAMDRLPRTSRSSAGPTGSWWPPDWCCCVRNCCFRQSPEADAEAEREAAREIERLDALRFVRAAAAWLQDRPQLGHDVFAHPRSGTDPRVASYMALMEACLTVLRGREGEPDAAAAVYRPPIPNLFRVPDALVRMRARLAEIIGAEPLEAFLPRMPQTTTNRELLARSAVSSTFMAALELARGAELALDQDAAFQGIVVTPLGAPAPEPVAAQAHE